MAVFDRITGKLVIRIVYDGPAFAGKTTNLQQLTEVFTPRRRSELLSSEGVNGRTLFLDWLRVDGGLIAGNAMSCHLITVPGQATLSARRSHLLSLADVVVFVANSNPESLRENATLLTVLREDAPDVPLVLQANKQDVVGALSPKELRIALGLSDAVPCIGAQADNGIGVRETMVIAVRTASSGVQRTILEAGLPALEGVAVSGEDLLTELKGLEHSQQVSRVDLVLERHRARKSVDETITVAEVRSDDSLASSDAAGEVASSDAVEQTTPADAAGAVAPSGAAMPSDADVGAERLDPAVEDKRSGVGEAPLPTAVVPSGYIWPSATGREILRRIPIDEAVVRTDLVGQLGTQDGSGSADTCILEAGPWCLKTSRRRRFGDVELAREQLLTLARKKILLGGLLVKDTVLTLTEDSTGNHWLWTVSPWVATLRSRMTLAVDTENIAQLEDTLAAFARVAVESMQLAARNKLALDVHPSNFACVRERVYYIDDDIALSSNLPAMGHSLLRRIDEYVRWPTAIESYLTTLEEALREGLTREDVDRIGLSSSLADASTRSDEAAAAKRRLLSTVEGILLD